MCWDMCARDILQRGVLGRQVCVWEGGEGCQVSLSIRQKLLVHDT